MLALGDEDELQATALIPKPTISIEKPALTSTENSRCRHHELESPRYTLCPHSPGHSSYFSPTHHLQPESDWSGCRCPSSPHSQIALFDHQRQLSLNPPDNSSHLPCESLGSSPVQSLGTFSRHFL